MNRPILHRLVLAATFLSSTALAVFFLSRWFAYDPTAGLDVCLPGRDGRPDELAAAEPVIDLAGTFQKFDGVPSSLPGAWPRFRGADFDNICKNPLPLANTWNDGGPPILWSIELGEGHAGPVIFNGRVYLIDYDEKVRADAVRCLSLDDGREIWRRSYSVNIKRNHGMSRTIPAVNEDCLVTMGPRCHVVCLDPITGDFRWGIDLQREYGTEEPLWYTGQCPLLDGDNVILAPCGPKTLMMAVDGRTGRVVWETPNPQGWTMSHSSIIPMTLAGVRMYVYCALGGVAGIAAEGDQRGQMLWESPWNARVIAPSPVAIDNDRIFLAAGYGTGNRMLQIRKENGKFSASVLFENSPKDGLSCEQQTPVYHAGLLYGIMPKDAGTRREQFVSYHPEGRFVWYSGPDNRFGLGPFLLADGKFFVLSDDGVLSLLQASAEAFVLLDQARILDGHDAWAPLALAGDRLLLRDATRMVCIDVGVKDKEHKG